MPGWSQAYSNAKVAPKWAGTGIEMSANLGPNLSLPAGTVLGQIENSAVNSVQTLSMGGTPTGGTFTLTFQGQTTTPIAFNATAAIVQAALWALSTIGTNGVICTGGPLPGSGVVITANAQLGGLPLATIAAVSALTGTSPTISLVSTTTGVSGGKFVPYASGNSDGSQLPKCVLENTWVTDYMGNATPADTLGMTPEFGVFGQPSVPAWACGVFRVGDLTGLDANSTAGANAFGRFINGNLTNPEGLFKIY